MDKLDLAKQLLEQINMPAKQQSTLCCLALLAMAKLKRILRVSKLQMIGLESMT